MALDALVVLGCRVRSGGALSPAAARRVRRAAELFHAGVAARVVASGGKLWDGVPEAECFARELERLGVPRSAVLCELWSESTIENARYVAKLTRRSALTRLGVVTCDWHMARALIAFRRHDLEVTPFPAPAPGRSWMLRALRAGSERVHRAFDRVRVLSEALE